MNEKRQATSVKYRWDDQSGVEPGWYCESYDDDGDMIDDSMKIWWPVNVDDYGRDEVDEMVQALQDAFPDATVEPW